MAAKKKVGRPSLHSVELEDAICLAIATSVASLNKLCEQNPHFPDAGTIWHWLSVKEGFQNKYAQAKQAQALLLADQLIELTDNDRTSEEVTTEDEIDVTGLTPKEAKRKINIKRHDNYNRTRLQIDTRKWLLSKLLPKKFGDTVTLEGSKDAPIQIVSRHLTVDDLDDTVIPIKPDNPKK